MNPGIYYFVLSFILNGLKNARISSAITSGSSMAVKCPPRGIEVQRVIFRFCSAHFLGGNKTSAGKRAMPVGTSMRPIKGKECTFSLYILADDDPIVFVTQ